MVLSALPKPKLNLKNIFYFRMRSSSGPDDGGELRKRLRIHLLPGIYSSNYTVCLFIQLKRF